MTVILKVGLNLLMASKKPVSSINIFRGFILNNAAANRSLSSVIPLKTVDKLTTGDSALAGTVKEIKNLTEGDTVSINKLVSIGDVDDFCELTGDYNPIHTKSRIVHGALLNGLVSSVIGTSLPGPGTVVISQNLSFPAPCVAPQCVTVTVAITSARKVIGCEFHCSTMEGVIVLKGNAKLIMKK